MANMNAMTNSVVLTRLFEFCELGHLRKFRLVSKQWNDLALARCRNEMKVVIGKRRFQRNAELAEAREMEDWLQFDSSGVAFKNFELHGTNFCSDPTEFDEENYKHKLNMKRFWIWHGPWIQKLKLVDFTIDGFTFVVKAIFHDAPNLEELIIKRPSMTQGVVPDDRVVGEIGQPNAKLTSLAICLSSSFKSISIPWRFFFATFPNIKSLELSGCSVVNHLAPLVATLEEFSESGNNLELKNFHFETDDPRAGTELRRLIQLPGLALTSVNIRLGGIEDMQLDLFQSILLCHGSSLQKLRLDMKIRENNLVPRDLNFPFRTKHFVNLTEVSLGGPIVPHLNWLVFCSSLKVLKLLACDKGILAETKWDLLESLPLVKVFQFDTFPIPEEVMKTLVKLMPNVENLLVKVFTESLRVVFQNCEKLTHLEIRSIGMFGGEGDQHLIDDEAITGIVEATEERLPNLTNLENLQSLTITSDRRISDDAVWKGFLRMPLMKYLSVRMSAETSYEAFRALQLGFKQCKHNITRS